MSNTNSNNGVSPEAEKEHVLDVLNQLMSLNQMIVDQSTKKTKKFEGLGSRLDRIKQMTAEIDLPNADDELIAKYANEPDDAEPIAKPSQPIKTLEVSPVSSPAPVKKSSPVQLKKTVTPPVTEAQKSPSEAKKKFKAGVSKLKALPAFLQAGSAASGLPKKDLSKVAVKKLEEKEFLKRENGMLVTTNKKVEDREEEKKKLSVAERAKLFR